MRWLVPATVLSVAAGWAAIGLQPSKQLTAPSGTIADCDGCRVAQAANIVNLFEDPAEAQLRQAVSMFGEAQGFTEADKLEFRSVNLGGAKLAVCFAPGTPTWRISQFMSYMTSHSVGGWPSSGGIQPMYYAGGRWPGTNGTPVNLTWSFVPDGTALPSGSQGAGEAAENSNLFAQMDAKFGGIANRAVWIQRFQEIFDRWHALAGVNYTRVTFGGNDWDDGQSFLSASGAAGLRGDLRIGMHNIDGASGILAYNYFPGTGVGGNMVIDRSDSWQSSANGYLFLRNTLGHEHGHGLGLDHVCPAVGTKLMEPFLSTSYDGPRHDDIRGIQALYGDPFEPNDTAATATNVGSVANGGSVTNFWAAPAPISMTNDPNTSRCNLEGSGKVDYYKFTTSSPQTLSVTVAPMGLNYDDSTQASTGACNSGSFTNSLNVADLNFDVISTDGTTVITTSATAGLGGTETKSNIVLPNAGTYFIKVYAGNAPTQSQMYTFSLSLSNPVPSISSLNPSSATAGSGAFTLTVNGGNFLPTSVVRWNGGNRTTTYVSAAQLTASINAADVAAAGSATVTVFNPTPGGGTSNGSTFTINAATVTVPPTSVNTTRGLLQAGTVTDLSLSDDLFMGWRPGPVLSLSEAPVDVNVTATSPTASPSKLEFVLEAKVTTPNIGQRLYLFNYVTNSWEEVDFRTATTSDSSFTVTVTTNPSRFVDPGTLAIRARFAYKATGPVLTFPWSARVDQSVWRITQ